MGEVGVHLEDVVVALREGILEAGEVGGAEPQLARTVQDVDPAGARALQLVGDLPGPIRRVVVDDQHGEIALGENRADQVGQILALVVGGNNDQGAHH